MAKPVSCTLKQLTWELSFKKVMKNIGPVLTALFISPTERANFSSENSSRTSSLSSLSQKWQRRSSNRWFLFVQKTTIYTAGEQWENKCLKTTKRRKIRRGGEKILNHPIVLISWCQVHNLGDWHFLFAALVWLFGTTHMANFFHGWGERDKGPYEEFRETK